MSKLLQTIRESLYFSTSISIVVVVVVVDSLLFRLSLPTPYPTKVGSDHG